MAYPQHFPYGIGDDEPVTLTRDDGTPVTVHFHHPEACPDCEWQRAVDWLIQDREDRQAEDRHALFTDAGGHHEANTFRPAPQAVSEPHNPHGDAFPPDHSGAG